jgi:hypothetical protein
MEGIEGLNFSYYSNLNSKKILAQFFSSQTSLLGPCFVAPKVLREEAASAEVVPRR